MRSFLSTHWKILAALVVLILLAVLTMSPGEADASLAARLRHHVSILASDDDSANRVAPGRTARYIETTLARLGYQVHRQQYDAGGATVHNIEVSLANVGPGQRPTRIFIIGARVAPGAADDGSGTAAVLELARLLKHLRPSPGTELKFVFFVTGEASGNFIAFVGARESSALVAQALAAFRPGADLRREGLLAAPAYVQGVTLTDHRPYQRNGAPALMVTDTAFLRYPYFHTSGQAPEQPDCQGLARVVGGLSQTIAALAGMART